MPIYQPNPELRPSDFFRPAPSLERKWLLYLLGSSVAEKLFELDLAGDTPTRHRIRGEAKASLFNLSESPAHRLLTTAKMSIARHTEAHIQDTLRDVEPSLSFYDMDYRYYSPHRRATKEELANMSDIMPRDLRCYAVYEGILSGIYGVSMRASDVVEESSTLLLLHPPLVRLVNCGYDVAFAKGLVSAVEQATNIMKV